MASNNGQCTIVDVARKAGVSNGLVSHVLHGVGKNNIRVGAKTASKICKIAEDLNYRPNLAARQLVGKKSKIIGAFCAPVVNELNYSRIVAIGDIARKNGYHLMVTFGELQLNKDFVKETFEDFALRGIDGLVCVLHHYKDAIDYVAKLANSMFENVVFVDKPSLEDVSYVSSDIENAAQQATRYLLGHGRSGIGLVLDDLVWVTGPLLVDGYVRELNLHKIKIENERVWIRADNKNSLFKSTGFPTAEEAESIINHLIVRNNCDAIVCSTDFWAAELINVLQKMGYKVPEDISIVGLGNLNIGRYTSPKLTTFDYQVESVAEQSFRILHNLIENKNENSPSQVVILPKLIERESV